STPSPSIVTSPSMGRPAIRIDEEGRYTSGAIHIGITWDVDMTPAKEEILCRIQEVVRETSGIAFAYLYGSFLESDSYRDVDLGIYAEGEDRDEWTKLRDRLPSSRDPKRTKCEGVEQGYLPNRSELIPRKAPKTQGTQRIRSL
ncbi:MAG: hypothetical protein P8020_21845, partial [Acidobacteriota bacterium]